MDPKEFFDGLSVWKYAGSTVKVYFKDGMEPFVGLCRGLLELESPNRSFFLDADLYYELYEREIEKIEILKLYEKD